MACLGKGKHVLVEKPITMSAQHTAELIQIAKYDAIDELVYVCMNICMCMQGERGVLV